MHVVSCGVVAPGGVLSRVQAMLGKWCPEVKRGWAWRTCQSAVCCDLLRLKERHSRPSRIPLIATSVIRAQCACAGQGSAMDDTLRPLLEAFQQTLAPNPVSAGRGSLPGPIVGAAWTGSMDPTLHPTLEHLRRRSSSSKPRPSSSRPRSSRGMASWCSRCGGPPQCLQPPPPPSGCHPPPAGGRQPYCWPGGTWAATAQLVDQKSAGASMPAPASPRPAPAADQPGQRGGGGAPGGGGQL